MAEQPNEAATPAENQVLSRLERISESKPYKWFGLFDKLKAPFVFFGGFVVGLMHLSSGRSGTPLTGADVWLIVAKSLFVAVMTCSCLGLGVLIACVVRNLLWWRSKGPNALDWILGSVIGFVNGGFLLSPSLEGHATLIIITFVVGGWGFFMLIVLPTLHKLKVVDMTKPPPWSSS